MKTKVERKKFAVDMRKHPTKAERALLKELRWVKGHYEDAYGCLALKLRPSKKLMTCLRQHFKSGYILDFYFPYSHLAVEVDGGYHKSKNQKEYDLRRDARLAAAKVKTLRFTNEEVFGNVIAVVDQIHKEALLRCERRKTQVQ